VSQAAQAPEAGPYRELLGQVVVVDTDSLFTYLGCLEAADKDFLKLSEVDVHETQESGLPKERYVHEARGLGVRPNRRTTWVRVARVTSISRLADVISF